MKNGRLSVFWSFNSPFCFIFEFLMLKILKVLNGYINFNSLLNITFKIQC